MNEEKIATHPAERGIKSTIAGIIINIILAITKGVAGVLGNSYALVADAIESTSDVISSTIIYFGLKVSTIPRDKDHPYGHGKAEPLAAIVVTIALLVASIIIIIQSISNIRVPHESPEVYTLFVLAGVVIIKEALFRFVLKVGNETSSSAVKTDAWHHRSDAITSIAAFVGILIAVIGGEGYESADDWAALIASGIIILNAISLFIPAFNEIMDAAPKTNHIEEIIKIALTFPEVKGIEKCLVRKMGFDFFADIHIEVDGNLSVREGHKIAHRVKKALIDSNIRITDALIHIEPFEE